MRSNSHANLTPGAATDAGTRPVSRSARGPAEQPRQPFFEIGELLKTAVATRPALVLGAALAAGVLVGWLIKRR